MTIAKKVEEFKKKFLCHQRGCVTDSSHQFNHDLQGKLPEAFIEFLETSLREHGESEYKRGWKEAGGITQDMFNMVRYAFLPNERRKSNMDRM